MAKVPVLPLNADEIQSFLIGAPERVRRKITRRITTQSWSDLSEDDLVQDAMLLLLSALPCVDLLGIDDGNLYCLTIENNCIANAFRMAIQAKKRERAIARVAADEMVNRLADSSADNEVDALISELKDILYRDDIRILLAREIEQFPLTTRTVMTLLVTHRLSVSDVAQNLKYSVQYVYKTRADYLPKLNQALLRWWDEHNEK